MEEASELPGGRRSASRERRVETQPRSVSGNPHFEKAWNSYQRAMSEEDPMSPRCIRAYERVLSALDSEDCVILMSKHGKFREPQSLAISTQGLVKTTYLELQCVHLTCGSGLRNVNVMLLDVTYTLLDA